MDDRQRRRIRVWKPGLPFSVDGEQNRLSAAQRIFWVIAIAIAGLFLSVPLAWLTKH